MPIKKHYNRKLPTDKQTDYLFDYFMNEDKIDEQLKGQLDDEIAKKIENHQPKLDSRVVTDKPNKVFSENDDEYPDISLDSEDNFKKPNVDFDDESDYDDINSSSSQKILKSPYGQKINAVAPLQNYASDKKNYDVISERPLLGERLVDDIEKYVETPEERRARARDAYSSLQDLVERHDVKLTRRFTIDDDPDEMEAEIKMHRERRNKHNQVKFYKQILLNVVCGAEFLNDKYNPFEFKLKDWSRQIAMDLDDYTEVLEEIYEKYRDRGGKMAPEIKLLFMIIMSGVTFHLSQTLFGSGGLTNTIQNNPNVINKLLGPLMKGGGAGLLGGGNSNDEPLQARDVPPPNNDEILARIKKFNQNKNAGTKSDIPITTEAQSESLQHHKSREDTLLAIEREKRAQADMRAHYENQLRKQQEMHMAQMNDLKNQVGNSYGSNSADAERNNYLKNSTSIVAPIPHNNYASPKNQVLSDASKKPRFTENPLITNNMSSKQKFADLFDQSSENNLFTSEIKESSNSQTRNRPIKKAKGNTYDEILDSLNSTEDLDIIVTPKKSTRKPITSNKRPVYNTKKSNNSTARSTAKKRSNTGSDILSTTATRRNTNILKI
jgi:hypothetical protein